jgi:hypothetical protein
MEKLFEKNPLENKGKESEKESTFRSLKSLFSAIKKSFMSNVRTLFVKEEEISKKAEVSESFFGDVEYTKKLSEEAGEFYKELIPRSLHKPTQEYQTGKRLPGLEILEYLRTKFNAEAKDEDMQENFRSEIRDQETNESGTVFQECYNRYRRKDGASIIEEGIGNFFSHEKNMATSSLALTDSRTGKCLDLNRLLPSGCFFSPGGMTKYDDRLNTEGKRPHLESIPIPQDLKSYNGTNNSSAEDFYLRGDVVGYGDLTEKGGVLSLLHEISHAWQYEHYDQQERVGFEDFYTTVAALLLLIKESKEKIASGEDLNDNIFSVIFFKDHLVKEGVEIDDNNFIYRGQELKDDEVIITDSEENEFVVKSEKAKKIIKEHGQNERDAWAHALKMLRYLRQRGLDLEPGLKSLSDFQLYIGPCLDSHQQHLEGTMRLSNLNIRFSRKKNRERRTKDS